jgi:RNA-directed DNA polymerase
MLANVYLHYVLDEWFAEQVQPRLRGPSTLVRYCDDFVVLLASKDDAERVLAVLGKRLGKFGLQLHPDKTRLVDFRPGTPPSNNRGDLTLPTSFTFLGFTHVWGRSRKGKLVVWQFTAKDRFARALKTIDQQCRAMRHCLLRDQQHRLRQMLVGHYAYFGISGNYRLLETLRYRAECCWRRWLSKRSTKSHLSWTAFQRVLTHFPLPRARIIHCYTGA